MIDFQRNPAYELNAQTNGTIGGIWLSSSTIRGNAANRQKQTFTSKTKSSYHTCNIYPHSFDLCSYCHSSKFCCGFEQLEHVKKYYGLNTLRLDLITCKKLLSPNHGGISVTSGLNSLHYELGSVATYYCYLGYALMGQTTRTCEDTNGGTVTTGTWSGTPPYCQGKSLYACWVNLQWGHWMEAHQVVKVLNHSACLIIFIINGHNIDLIFYYCNN